MSSAEEDLHDLSIRDDKAKKRRVQRACDSCRRKKVRCDGAQMPNNRCSNCLAYNYECTYVEAAKKRGPPKGYVESLENRLEKMEKLLKSLCPDADFTQELGGHIDREAWAAERERDSPLTSQPSKAATMSPQTNALGAIAPGGPIFHEDHTGATDDECMTLPVHVLGPLAHTGFEGRFHGKSSGVMLAMAARDLKAEYTGSDVGLIPMSARRAQFWEAGPWELAIWQTNEPPQDIAWPPQDLFVELVDLYFRYSNAFIPLLHRPTFDALVEDKLHLRNTPFAIVVLLVCAFGSRWSNDVRVFRHPNQPSSAGWQFFEGVKHMKRSIFVPASLYDLQGYVLLALFLQATSSPHSAWSVIGIGIRAAQDVGAHRKGTVREETKAESELWKRAFWCLVVLDRMTSSGFGRPCAIQDEDFDLDLPLDVDDEYWADPDPEKAFKQPDGKPSKIAFFNSFIKLNEIISFTVRTIYSINKSKVILGFVGPQWESHIVAELDSALNKWIDVVPDHLRWDPNREDPVHFDQSAALYTLYYYIQILIHRPFIPSPKKPSALTFPSLAICTNAARSCSHILDVHRRRTDHILPATLIAAFTSGIVLLISVWGSKKAGVNADPTTALLDVKRCMQTLMKAETRWHTAGRVLDVLRDLASFGDLPVPAGSPPELTHKRDRDFDETTSPQSSSVSDLPVGSRPIAKGRSVMKGRSESGGSSSKLQQPSPQQQQASPLGGFSAMKLNHTPLMQSPQSQYADASPVPTDSFDMSQVSNFGFTGSDPMIWFGDQSQQSQQTQQSQQSQPQSQSRQQAMYMPQSQNGLSSLSFMGGQSQDMFAANNTSSPPFPNGNEFAPQPGFGIPAGGGYTGVPGPDGLMAGDTLAMWSNAPTNFEWEDWGSYLSTMTNANPVQQ